MPRIYGVCVSAFLIAVFVVLPILRLDGQSQGLTAKEKQEDIAILQDARDILQKNYYDPTFHGLDMNALYAKYEAKVEASNSNHDAFAWIAAYVDSLNDSHTRFIPPPRVGQVQYGYELQMIGDRCFVVHLRPGFDAAAKLQVGDEVTALNGQAVTRSNFTLMQYYFYALAPVTESNFDLLDPKGVARHVQIDSKVSMVAKQFTASDAVRNWITEDEEYQNGRDQYVENGDVIIWKLHQFFDDPFDVQQIFGRVRRHKTLIIDLRDDPGGVVDNLTEDMGYLFDHDFTVAERSGRKKLKPMLVKTHHSYSFSGKLIVLVDSNSASCAEVLARTVQLENRGTVIGDKSSGQVMESEGFAGERVEAGYGLYVTVADLTMKDGKSIEHVGVTPDETMIPTAQDLADGKDPVLAHAAQLAGWPLTPEQAGKLFPYKWTSL
jgi:C-terminal processing protease CtpA/Prc